MQKKLIAVQRVLVYFEYIILKKNNASHIKYNLLTTARTYYEISVFRYNERRFVNKEVDCRSTNAVIFQYILRKNHASRINYNLVNY